LAPEIPSIYTLCICLRDDLNTQLRFLGRGFCVASCLSGFIAGGGVKLIIIFMMIA
jgi:hypothetical protein